jgi:hypothetical protein
MRSCFGLLFVVFLLSACDPVHTLYLENKTSERLYITTASRGYSYRNSDTPPTSLAPGEVMRIGHCVAHYSPRPDDIDYDYLKITSAHDTITLEGKGAIFSMLQKVKSLNWRIIIRDKY